MEHNIGVTDRKIRGILAILLVVFAFWTSWSLWWMFLVIAAVLVVTVFTRQCLLYALFNCSTVESGTKRRASKKK